MKKKAFTLIELLIVIAVIAILFVVILSKVNFATDRAKDSGVLTDFRSYQIGIQQTLRENNFDSATDIATLNAELSKNLDKKMRFVQNGAEYQSVAYNPYGYHYVLVKDLENISVYSIKTQGDADILDAGLYKVYAASDYSVGKVMTIEVDKATDTPEITSFGDDTLAYQEKAVVDDDEGGGGVVTHEKPVAFISMNPSTNITESTAITWGYETSACEDGATIAAYEWEGMQSTYTAGEYTVRLRVKDSNDLWSEWTSTTFTVTAANRAPVPVIGSDPANIVQTDVNITWIPSATDPDGDAIVEYDWDGTNVAYYTEAGTYTVKLRAKDSKGLWSDYTTRTVTVIKDVWFNPAVNCSIFGSSHIADIAYSTTHNTYVMVGSSGRLAYSSDATNWYTATSQFGTASINAVAFGNGKFVIVGTTGKIAYSNNGGSSWTLATNPFGTTVTINDITYGASGFVAVGSNGKVAWSGDGVTWGMRTSGLESSYTWIRGVGYGNGLYVAVGNDGKLITSPNGSTWTVRTVPITTAISKVAYGNGKYVAIGDGGKIITSTNGIDWVEVTSGYDGNIYGISYGNGMFLSLGSAQTIMTSTDGVTWVKRAAATESQSWYNAAYNNNMFVAVGTSGYVKKITMN